MSSEDLSRPLAARLTVLHLLADVAPGTVLLMELAHAFPKCQITQEPLLLLGIVATLGAALGLIVNGSSYFLLTPLLDAVLDAVLRGERRLKIAYPYVELDDERQRPKEDVKEWRSQVFALDIYLRLRWPNSVELGRAMEVEHGAKFARSLALLCALWPHAVLARSEPALATVTLLATVGALLLLGRSGVVLGLLAFLLASLVPVLVNSADLSTDLDPVRVCVLFGESTPILVFLIPGIGLGLVLLSALL